MPFRYLVFIQVNTMIEPSKTIELDRAHIIPEKSEHYRGRLANTRYMGHTSSCGVSIGSERKAKWISLHL